MMAPHSQPVVWRDAVTVRRLHQGQKPGRATIADDEVGFFSMGAECDGSEVVVRFTPISAEKLLENAEDTFEDDRDAGRKQPRYGVSVLAGWCEDGEDIAATVERIVGTSSLTGRTVAVLTGTILRANGFEIVEDATEREPLHHLVGEDPFTAAPRVDVLASLLDDGRMRNPARRKGIA